MLQSVINASFCSRNVSCQIIESAVVSVSTRQKSLRRSPFISEKAPGGCKSCEVAIFLPDGHRMKTIPAIVDSLNELPGTDLAIANGDFEV